MAKFRKKPVVIDAVQWFPGDPAFDDMPGFYDAWRHALPDRAIAEAPGAGLSVTSGFAWIETLEGGHLVTPGDWIITGVAGEVYPCKPSIFAATYEPAGEPQPF